MNMCGICVDEYVEVAPLPSLKLSRPDPAISQFCPVFLFFHSLTKTLYFMFSSSSILISVLLLYSIKLLVSLCWSLCPNICLCFCGSDGVYSDSAQCINFHLQLSSCWFLADLPVPGATKARVSSHHTQVSLLKNEPFLIYILQLMGTWFKAGQIKPRLRQML